MYYKIEIWCIKYVNYYTKIKCNNFFIVHSANYKNKKNITILPARIKIIIDNCYSRLTYNL